LFPRELEARSERFAIVAPRKRRHDRYPGHRNFLSRDAASGEHRGKLLRRDEEAIRRRLNPESMRIEIRQHESQRETVAAAPQIRREDLTGKEVRRQDRVGVEVADETAKAREFQPIEEPDESGLPPSPRRMVARAVEISPKLRSSVDHLQIALHISLAIDGFRKIEHVRMENLGLGPERLSGLLQSLRRAGVSGASRNRKNEEPVQRRACWIKRIAATRMPMTTTAARALSRPMKRANRAPA